MSQENSKQLPHFDVLVKAGLQVELLDLLDKILPKPEPFKKCYQRKEGQYYQSYAYYVASRVFIDTWNKYRGLAVKPDYLKVIIAIAEFLNYPGNMAIISTFYHKSSLPNKAAWPLDLFKIFITAYYSPNNLRKLGWSRRYKAIIMAANNTNVLLTALRNPIKRPEITQFRKFINIFTEQNKHIFLEMYGSQERFENHGKEEIYKVCIAAKKNPQMAMQDNPSQEWAKNFQAIVARANNTFQLLQKCGIDQYLAF